MDRITRELAAAMRDFAAGEGGRFSAVFTLVPEFVGFAGHFPGRPILPAVAQIQMAALVLGRGLGLSPSPERVENAKFTRPVGPGKTVYVECNPSAKGGGVYSAALRVEEGPVASVSLRLEEPCA